MKSKRITKVTKKLLVGLLAVAVIISGMAVVPVGAANDAIIPDATKGIKYVPYASVTYSADETKVPVEKDFVFGGWYQKDESTAAGTDDVTFAAMREKPADSSTDTANVYAKFVPAYVLSVKMQLTKGTTAETASTIMRVLSAVDDTNYREVGFEIYLGTSATSLETQPVTTVYQALKLNPADSAAEAIKPETTFGTAAQYFSGINLTDIAKANYASIVYVRPYWVTLDGTKVEGMARNVHVEDEYEDYISVPVNILSGEEVAGGKLTLTYAKDKLVVVADTTADGTAKGFEAGRLLTEMDYYVDDTNGTVTIVGNAETVGENVVADGLFANIRFKEKEGVELTDRTGILTRKTDGIQEFCNWAEEDVEVTVWDYK